MKIIPRIKGRIYTLKRWWKKINAKRECNICGHRTDIFDTVGQVSRTDAMCPACGSFERHRLVFAYLKQKMNSKMENKTMLHIAPEACLSPKFNEWFSEGYLTADLFNEQVMVKMDIQNIEYPDESFDAIYCSHVLEHVDDDKKAMREFHRTLKREGWAILNVPVNNDVTIEDPGITDPKERLRLFGQEDHVRKYGPDYQERLTESGFKVRKVSASDFLKKTDMIRFGLSNVETGDIYFCTKN